MDVCFLEHLGIALVATSARLEQFPLLVIDQPDIPPSRSQTKIGIVNTQKQPMLRPRCEHPIRLEASSRHEVVDKNADIRILPSEHERLPAVSPHVPR